MRRVKTLEEERDELRRVKTLEEERDLDELQHMINKERNGFTKLKKLYAVSQADLALAYEALRRNETALEQKTMILTDVQRSEAICKESEAVLEKALGEADRKIEVLQEKRVNDVAYIAQLEERLRAAAKKFDSLLDATEKENSGAGGTVPCQTALPGLSNVQVCYHACNFCPSLMLTYHVQCRRLLCDDHTCLNPHASRVSQCPAFDCQ